MPQQHEVTVPTDLLVRLVGLLDKIERQRPVDHDKPIIIRPLKRAFKMAGVGNTRGHEMIREGVFEVATIGKRGKGITLRSIEALINSGQAA